jgi:adenylate cyclase
MIALGDIRDCFEGVIPSVVATLDGAGVPNVSYLSQVHLVDADHVALSNQFFSKTGRNIEETGQATVLVVDGRSGDQYRLDLRFESASRDGEAFDRIDSHLKASEVSGGIPWQLRSADIYRVLDCRPVPNPPDVRPAPTDRTGQNTLAAAAQLSARMARESDPDLMLDLALDGLTAPLGFSNAMLLVMDERGKQLTTLGSRGYATGGVGSEVKLGEGAIGVAAARGCPVRLCDMSRGRRFAAAVLAASSAEAARNIPLPGLTEPQSQLAVPLISMGKVRGVLFAEDARRFRFRQAEEDALAMIASQLAACLRLSELENAGTPPKLNPPAQSRGPQFHVRYHSFDDSLFIDGTYVIKGVPGRLLFHFLQAHAETGRTDFTNRELRLDATLRLPDLKDNLETRLILLRRRLAEKKLPVQLTRPGRGHIRLELSGTPKLEVMSGAV